jgi:hypothetical protein
MTSCRTLADVTDAGAVAALAARLRREFGRADILVNNAGVFPERTDFAQPPGGQRLGRRSGNGRRHDRLQRAGAAAPDSGDCAADARKRLRAHRQCLVGDGATVRNGWLLARLPDVESGAQRA